MFLALAPTKCWSAPPSHVDEMVWMLVVFLETFLYLYQANSHQESLVCLDIPVVITRQGDISELGLDGFYLL